MPCERMTKVIVKCGKVMLGHPPAFWSIRKGRQYAALVEFQLSFDAYRDDLQTAFRLLKAFPALLSLL